ncbi:MAG: pirin family protein [Alphaproteobacteria bacterium]
MITVTPFAQLGKFRNDWLNATHHFSFGTYRDPQRTGVGPLLVWNDDTIAPGRGFDLHGHRDMEIVTVVRSGAVSHRDHLGNKGRTVAGDVQVMSAGSGILHAEYNFEDIPTTLFQIWIQPEVHGISPHWETKSFPRNGKKGLTPLASGRPEDKESGALPIHCNAAILGAHLAAGSKVHHRLASNRAAYLVADGGKIKINSIEAAPRDGIAVQNESELDITVDGDTNIVLVDVALTE